MTSQAATSDATGSWPGMRPDERRPYRLLMLGGTTSVLGTQITAVALPLLLIHGVTSNAFLLSLVAASRYLPFIFFSLSAGGFVDRHPPLLVMAWCDALRIGFVVAIPFLYLLGALDIVSAVVLVLATATCRVFFDLSSAKYMVLRFHPDSFLRVNAGLDTAANTGELIGPSAAGAFAASIGAAWALVFDAFSYVVSLATVIGLRRAPTPPSATDEQNDVPAESGEHLSARSAIKLIWKHTALRFLLIGTSFQNLALMTAQGVSLLYLVVGKHLSGGAAAVIITALGLGSIIGAASAPAIGRRLRLLRGTALVAPLTALGPLGLLAGQGTPASLIFGVLGHAVLGAAIAVSSALSRRYRQGIVPAHVFGRVSGVYGGVLMGMLPLGAALGGFIGDVVSLPAVMVASASIFVLAAASVIAAMRVDPPTPTPVP